MFKWSAPLLEFPTTITLIDDVAQFMASLQFEIDPHSFNTHCFDNPHQGLDYLLNINDQAVSSDWLTRSSSQETQTLSVNLSAIEKEVLSPKRFETRSILIVDYMMPGLNGLEICRSLRDKPFKKILLTGAADEKLATRAFNEGLIDRFIRKDDRTFSHTFGAALKALRQSYFKDQCRLVQSTLESTLPAESALRAEPYEKLFKDTLLDENIKEFYLLDTLGSFLCVKYEGQVSLLKVHTRHQLDHFAGLAKKANAPEMVCRKIENKAYLPFSFDAAVMDNPASWGDHLYYCENIGNDIYFAYIDDTRTFSKFAGAIVSFKEFMAAQLPMC